MSDITAWAVALFEQTGGPDWRTDLALGGVTVVAGLVIVCALLVVSLVRR